MNLKDKIIPQSRLIQWREFIHNQRSKLVVTNGCFDILHSGHVSYLEHASKLGDVLLVGINSDSAVKMLKGKGRPINREHDRAIVVAALQSVGAVCIFQQKDASTFLDQSRPDVYVKGGDYSIETINQAERQIIETHGGKIVFAPVVNGKSTTSTIEKIIR